MAACPNCGRQTMRTTDWVCQWCGYPLLGRGYKKIDKTFKELQEERRLGLSDEGAEAEYEPEPEVKPEPPPKPRPTPVPRPKPAPRPEPPPPAPKPEPEVEPEEVPGPEAEHEPEPAPEAEPVPPSRPQPPPRPELKMEPVARPGPALDPGPVLAKMGGASGTAQVSVDELDAAYQADKLTAHTRLTGKVLTITGLVEKIFVKEHLDIRYIVLTGTRVGTFWKVRCTFERENAGPLGHLAEGGAAVVRGKYDGYGNNIIMKECALII